MRVEVWVLSQGIGPSTLERLGDARLIADQIGTGVGAFVIGVDRSQAGSLISRGADRVEHVTARPGAQSILATSAAALARHRPRLVLACGDCWGREWGSRLAVRMRWRWVSPALMVRVRDQDLEVTQLDSTHRRAQKVCLKPGETVVTTLRPGVGEALPVDADRHGEVVEAKTASEAESVRQVQVIPGNPASIDIRHAEKLVAGGRGVGSKEGFDSLRRFAGKIGAGVAASRMAVDLGWLEYERQVGQTGKTVAPGLYIACGISGASHHLDGMSGSEHRVAINTDPKAPIFRIAHLGLVADLHEVLRRVEEGLRE